MKATRVCNSCAVKVSDGQGSMSPRGFRLSLKITGSFDRASTPGGIRSTPTTTRACGSSSWSAGHREAAPIKEHVDFGFDFFPAGDAPDEGDEGDDPGLVFPMAAAESVTQGTAKI